LSDGVLIQAARHYDLATLAGALTDAVRLALPSTTTFLEATNFLIHQQHRSGALGARCTIEKNLNSLNAVIVTASLAARLAAVGQYLDTFVSQPRG
jgi:uncharacterized PurR-regulated membrane protein YhhQ (DUF165 family)